MKPISFFLAATCVPACIALAVELGGAAFGFTVTPPDAWRTKVFDETTVGFTQERFEFPADSEPAAADQIDCRFTRVAEPTTVGKTQDEVNADTDKQLTFISENAARNNNADRRVEAVALEHKGIHGGNFLEVAKQDSGETKFRHFILWQTPGYIIMSQCIGGLPEGPDYEALTAALPSFLPIAP